MYVLVVSIVSLCVAFKGEVIPAWEIAIASMRKTELSRYLVKPEYAYGAVGCPPRIPPSASSTATCFMRVCVCVCVCIMAASSVVFEIEVLSFVDSSAVNQYQSYSKEEKERISIDQLLQVANTEREVCTCIYKCKLTALN